MVLFGAALAIGAWPVRVYRTGVIKPAKINPRTNSLTPAKVEKTFSFLTKGKSTPKTTLLNTELFGVLFVPRLIPEYVCFTFADVFYYFKFYGFLVLIFSNYASCETSTIIFINF